MPGGDVPRPMTQAEIKEQIGWMVDAAKAFVEEAGGDGVESESIGGAVTWVYALLARASGC